MTIKPNRPVPKIHNARCTVAFFTEPYAVSPVVCSRSNSDAINISNIYKRIAYPLVIDYMFCNLIFICEWCDHNDEWYLTINPETNNNSNNDYKTKRNYFSNFQLQSSISGSPTALICSICGNDQIITDSESGEMICRRCGQVISDRIQETLAEWRNFPDTDESKNRNRTGMSASLAWHDKGLSTIIGRSDKDASGHPLDAVMRTTMARLRTWDSRSQFHTSTDRNLQHAFDQLYALKDKLGLSDAVLEKTAYIYRKDQDKRLVRGSTISAILIAAVYAAYRETGIARTLKDLSTASNIKRKDIARSYMLIATELDPKVPIIDPVKYVAKIANKAGLSEKTKRKAIGIMNDAITRKISDGKSPMGLAGSVLYLACLVTGETKSQSDVAHAADITEVTVRSRFKDLKNNFLNSNQ